MTTSITDARFTSLHFTEGHLASLDFDPPPESGWGVMPGFDETLAVPMHLEPPRLDADETLPNMLHPSYPWGRPAGKAMTKGATKSGGSVVGNLLGTVGGWEGQRAAVRDEEDMWGELGTEELVERQSGREVPPGMAGAKRPPSPSSPALRPDSIPAPRSVHLQNLYARQQEASLTTGRDPFDAPVPNETYPPVDTSVNEGEGRPGDEESEGDDEQDSPDEDPE